MAELAITLPFQMLPVADGDTQPKNIEVSDISCLCVRFAGVGETGIGKPIGTSGVSRYELSGSAITVHVAPIAEKGEAAIIIDGKYGQVNLHAKIVLNVGAGIETITTVSHYVFKAIATGGGDYKTDVYMDSVGRVIIERMEDGSTVILDENENPIAKREANGTTKFFDANNGERFTIDANGNIHFAEFGSLYNQVASNTQAIQGIAANGGASVASSVLFNDGENAEVKVAKKTEKVIVDIVAVGGSYEFHKGTDVLNFQELNAMLQTSPDFVLFVHDNIEHRCVRIELDGNQKYIEFVSTVVDSENVKVQSFLVESVDGVQIFSVKRTDIICENKTDTDALRTKVGDLSEEVVVEIKGIFDSGATARANLQVGDYFGYYNGTKISSIAKIEAETITYKAITSNRYVIVDNMPAYIEDGKLYFVGNGGLYKVDSLENYPNVGGHFSSVNGILYYMPTTASSWVVKYFKVNIQNGTIVERSIGESYYYNEGSFVLIPSDIESIYLEQGAIKQNGTDSTSVNLNRLRSGKIYGTLDLTLPDGYVVYLLYYYNISDSSLNERKVVNYKHCLIGKSGCYARIVISKSGDTNLVVTDVKHTTSIEEYHDAINNLYGISIFNKHAEFGVVPTDIYVGKQEDYSFGSKWTTSADLLAKFDALVDGKYITKQSIGKDSENKDMWMYSTNPQPSQIIGVQPKGKYRVLVVCSQHGFEKAAAFSMYYVLKELVENAMQSNVLQYIADNIQLNVIPVPNQYGWDNLMYTNANQVNLNRNWGVNGWKKEGSPGTSTYTGEAAFDQAETSNIRDWMLANKDVTLVVDYHTNGSSRLELGDGIHAEWLSMSGIGVGSKYRDRLVNVADISLRTMRSFFNRIYSTDMAGYDKDSYWYSDNAGTPSSGTLSGYGYEQGFLSLTIEGFCGFPADPSAGYSANTKKANTEEFVNFLAIFSHMYGGL